VTFGTLTDRIGPAGPADPDEPRSPVIVGYAWLLRALLLVVAALILRKLGLGDLVQLIIGQRSGR
jgi:hypothetical protein